MKNNNLVTVILSDDTLAILQALMLRQEVSADRLISRLLWDVSRYVFTQKELILLAETVSKKNVEVNE